MVFNQFSPPFLVGYVKGVIANLAAKSRNLVRFGINVYRYYPAIEKSAPELFRLCMASFNSEYMPLLTGSDSPLFKMTS